MKAFLLTLSLLVFACGNTFGQKPKSNSQKTWTYTYLKAKTNQKENLKKYLKVNWFAMDSIAVAQGLFNDYKLLENTKSNAETEWDFIVAVEYFTAGTYKDIEQEWLEIRKNHKPVSIEGKSFKDLGSIIKSEELQVASSEVSKTPCTGERFEMIEGFMGEWKEYLVGNEGEELYGKLTIEIDPKGCGLKKQFTHLKQPFTYATLGYFNSEKSNWIETYTFSNGGYAIYEWQKDKNDFLLYPIQSSFTRTSTTRNRWKIISKDLFQIIVEESKDSGKTWKISSTTNMRRI